MSWGRNINRDINGSKPPSDFYFGPNDRVNNSSDPLLHQLDQYKNQFDNKNKNKIRCKRYDANRQNIIFQQFQQFYNLSSLTLSQISKQLSIMDRKYLLDLGSSSKNTQNWSSNLHPKIAYSAPDYQIARGM